MQTQILKLKDVVAFTTLSSSTIYRLTKTGDFPKPIKLASHASGWLLADVERWLKGRQIASLNEVE